VSGGQSIRPFLARLEREGSLLRIPKGVDRCFELSAFLSAADAGPALLFDEDVAKGTTLTGFAAALRPLFQASSTASVLRHSLSPCWPDFTGHAWND